MRHSPSLGPLEQQVMSFVWSESSGGAVTVRKIFDEIKKEKRVAYTTIMTIMHRLEDKGLLKRTKYGKAHLYSPRTSPRQTVKSLVHQTLQSLVNHFGYDAITAFADELQQLPEEEQRFFVKEFGKVKTISKV